MSGKGFGFMPGKGFGLMPGKGFGLMPGKGFGFIPGKGTTDTIMRNVEEKLQAKKKLYYALWI